MSGTDAWRIALPERAEALVLCCFRALRRYYPLSAYARAMRCPVRTKRCRPISRTSVRACYAMSSTDVAYVATRIEDGSGPSREERVQDFSRRVLRYALPDRPTPVL
eukprot:3412780-Rhodomonas_salina.2